MDPACVTRDAARAHWLARPWPGPHHALRARTLVPPGASAPVPYEVATTASGAIAARTPDGSSAAEGYGMALGVADLDADGRLDVLTSEARDPGAGDRLHLLRVEPDGRLVHVWRSAPLAGSVYVGAGGDADGDGREELLAVEEPTTPGAPATLWVVR